jgi:predicted nuclease of restriction endonuclease-like RecB superfamily
MLPSNLLRARISRGRIRPVYVRLDADATALAERVAGIFSDAVGKRKGELLERLTEVENEGHDFKLVRGLSTLLERRCTFEAESALNPVEARKAAFKEASRARASSPGERNGVLQKVSTELGVSQEALERTLFSDIEDELILKEFRPLKGPDTLLKYYNLAVTQTLLFKSLRVEFSASGNWKNIFRDIKRFGLIYSVERGGDGGYKVNLDGPLSLFKMTERYGTSIAKLLPQITAADSWTIEAEILARSRGGKVYSFEAGSEELKDLITNVGRGEDAIEEDQQTRVGPQLYDSTTEEKFAKSFLSYGTGWALKREPEPLIAGTHVLIPDFRFEKDGMKVYLEVVGFWTPQYLERKIIKLNSIAGVDMIIAADESLACSKLERLKGKALVIYYRREVPLKPIIEHLREREASVVGRQVERLKGEQAIALKGDVVSIEEIAIEKGVAAAAARMALQDFKPEGYVRVGDRLFVSRAKLDEIEEKLMGVERLKDALEIIEASGVKEEGGKVLETLGYASVWEGIDMDKVRITKKTPATTTATRTASSA